jgi:hypothetical protein
MTDSNLPKPVINDSGERTQTFFNGYFDQTVNIQATEWEIVRGFFLEFTNNDQEAATALAEATITSALANEVMPVSVIEEIKGLTDLEIDSVLATLFNTTRRNTSLLGFRQPTKTNKFVERNIKA